MVAVSLMPPVDYCTSCEGRRATDKARDVASAREAEIAGGLRGRDADKLSPGALPALGTEDSGTKPVDPAARPLLSPDLVVQASLAKTESSAVDDGANPALRLQAFQAYGAAPGGSFDV